MSQDHREDPPTGPSLSALDPLKQRERDFHDRAFEEDLRSEAGVSSFYAITEAAREKFRSLLPRRGGVRVLEFGCGRGSEAFSLGRQGATVVGIDISSVAIDQARQRAAALGLSEVCFEVGDAEQLSFRDRSFDVVCGSGILHHLDLRAAYKELMRVVRPGGSCVFFEPLGHNPLINRYRQSTPDLRTPDEHPLLMSDLRMAEEYFATVNTWYFHLTTLLAVPFRHVPGSRWLVRLLDLVDRLLFACVPPLKKHAWVVVMELRDPREAEVQPAGMSNEGGGSD